MTTQQTQPTVTKARAALVAAEKNHDEAVHAVTDAERAAAELRQRNTDGDATVTGLALLTADANVEAARGLEIAAGREVDRARQQLGELVAEKVATDVAARYTPAKVEAETARIRDTMTDALGSLVAWFPFE